MVLKSLDGGKGVKEQYLEKKGIVFCKRTLRFHCIDISFSFSWASNSSSSKPELIIRTFIENLSQPARVSYIVRGINLNYFMGFYQCFIISLTLLFTPVRPLTTFGPSDVMSSRLYEENTNRRFADFPIGENRDGLII